MHNVEMAADEILIITIFSIPYHTTDSWDSCRVTGQAYSMDHNYIIIYYE